MVYADDVTTVLAAEALAAGVWEGVPAALLLLVGSGVPVRAGVSVGLLLRVRLRVAAALPDTEAVALREPV